jgi:toxin ParE1/3/4
MAHRLSPEAEAELDAIWWYLAEQSGSPEIAGSAIASITERFHLLSTYPQLGRRRDDLRPGLRSYPAGSYVIVYRIDGPDVLVLHIFHGSRDIEALLRRSR